MSDGCVHVTVLNVLLVVEDRFYNLAVSEIKEIQSLFQQENQR